ncbi:MAG: NAD(P)-dependent oxidoreductase, partial [Lawsonibacter sp.]
MKILVFGPKARYSSYLPEFTARMDVRTVFCSLDDSPVQAAADHSDAEILFTDPIVDTGKEIMDLLPNLKLIQSEGVAFHRIDLEEARRRGIFVCNNKGCNAASVAEHTVMLMLMALRHGITGHNAVREGRQIQMKEAVMASDSPELGGCSVGLVGFGDIAQATARRLAPFGCPLYYYSLHRRSPEVEADFGVTYLPLEELAALCDILSLHCAVNDQTRNLINSDLISRMKPSSILVNTARGDLVDNLAVRQALLEGRIAGIAVDTLAPEPTPGDHPLVDLPPEARDRAIYSPHLGGNTGGSFRRAHTNM